VNDLQFYVFFFRKKEVLDFSLNKWLEFICEVLGDNNYYGKR